MMLDLPELLAPARIVRGLTSMLCSVAIDLKPATLTLPCIECRGFFLQPARLPVARLGRGVEAVCPEAFATDVA